MTTTVSARSLSRDYSKILDRVKTGETIGVIKGDELVAVLRSPKDFELKEIEEIKKDIGYGSQSLKQAEERRPELEVAETDFCEVWKIDSHGKCSNLAPHSFAIPHDWLSAGQTIKLCDSHFKQANIDASS